MSDRTVRFVIRRQSTPQSEPFWEEFDLRWRPGMNVISGLMDIAMNPVDRTGKATTPIAYDSNCLRGGLRVLRHAHKRQSRHGVLVSSRQA